MSQFKFSIVRSKRRVSGTSISVGPKGVVVHAPFWIPVWVINKFVEEKRDWIERQLKNHSLSSIKEKLYQDGEEIFFLGKKLVIKITETDKIGRTTVTLAEEAIEITISMHFEGNKRIEEIKKSLTRWYTEQGVEHITRKVNDYAQKIGVNYAKITLKDVSSIWGSCSAKNNLNFNRNLIMAPHEVIDYVVIHEVCHLVHRDHSSRFWGLVRSLDPDYKTHRLWLKQNRLFLSL